MLDVLQEVENGVLAELLTDNSHREIEYYTWYGRSFMERVLYRWGDYEIHLNKLLPIPRESVVYHFHPWPCILKILDGEYEMGLGFGPRRAKEPPISGRFFNMMPGNVYEMPHRNGWHYVWPSKGPVKTLFICGPEDWRRRDDTFKRGLNRNLKIHKLEEVKGEEILDFYRKIYVKRG